MATSARVRWVDVMTLWDPWPDFSFSFLLPDNCFALRLGALRHRGNYAVEESEWNVPLTCFNSHTHYWNAKKYAMKLWNSNYLRALFSHIIQHSRARRADTTRAITVNMVSQQCINLLNWNPKRPDHSQVSNRFQLNENIPDCCKLHDQCTCIYHQNLYTALLDTYFLYLHCPSLVSLFTFFASFCSILYIFQLQKCSEQNSGQWRMEHNFMIRI
jgi:hypothetical protein